MDSNNLVESHPHAKVWMGVTIIVILIAVAAVIYFLMKARQVNNPSPTTAGNVTATNPSPTTDTSTKATVGKDTAPKTVTKEITNLNVTDIQNTVKDLQTVLSSLK